MQKSFSTFRNRSFIISLLLHGIVALLFVYLKFDDQKWASEPEQKPRVPAQVSYQSYPMPLQSQPASQQQKAVQPAKPSQPISSGIRQVKQSLPIKAQVKADEATVSQQVTSSSSEAEPKDSAIGRPGTSPFGRRAGSTSEKPSGKAFMNAFKNAVYSERAGSYGKESSGTNVPQHVQQRLEDWAEHHYRDRIHKAILKAGSIHSRYLRHDRDLNTQIVVTIPIHKDGTLGDMSQEPLSGIEEVDSYIRNVLKIADFPPIPGRFKKDVFYMKMNLTISLKQGSGMYHIS